MKNAAAVDPEIIAGEKLLSLFLIGVKPVIDLKVAKVNLQLLDSSASFEKGNPQKILELLDNFQEFVPEMPLTMARVFLAQNDPTSKFVVENQELISELTREFVLYSKVLKMFFGISNFETLSKLNSNEISDKLIPPYCLFLVQNGMTEAVLEYLSSNKCDDRDKIYWQIIEKDHIKIMELIDKGFVGITPLICTFTKLLNFDQGFVKEKLSIIENKETYDFVYANIIDKFRLEENSALISNLVLTKCPYIINSILQCLNNSDKQIKEKIESLFTDLTTRNNTTWEVFDKVNFAIFDKDTKVYIFHLILNLINEDKLDLSICPKLKSELYIYYLNSTKKEFGSFEKCIFKFLKLKSKSEMVDHFKPILIFPLLQILTTKFEMIYRQVNLLPRIQQNELEVKKDSKFSEIGFPTNVILPLLPSKIRFEILDQELKLLKKLKSKPQKKSKSTINTVKPIFYMQLLEVTDGQTSLIFNPNKLLESENEAENLVVNVFM